MDAHTIAGGSVDQAFEGRHYFRSMRIHKELFDALIQYRFEDIQRSTGGISEGLYSVLINLRKTPLHCYTGKRSKTFSVLSASISL